MALSPFGKLFGAACALSVLAAPTAALAANPSSLSPLVSLSMVASPQSQAALCAVGTTVAAETTANAQAAPQGCVLPVPDAAVAPLPGQAAVAPTGFSPLLIGLGAIGLGVLLFALLHGDDQQAPPQPVSPS